jgi:hypothetical protein
MAKSEWVHYVETLVMEVGRHVHGEGVTEDVNAKVIELEMTFAAEGLPWTLHSVTSIPDDSGRGAMLVYTYVIEGWVRPPVKQQ